MTLVQHLLVFLGGVFGFLFGIGMSILLRALFRDDEIELPENELDAFPEDEQS